MKRKALWMRWGAVGAVLLFFVTQVFAASPFTWNLSSPSDTSIVSQFPALNRADKATLASVLGTLTPQTNEGTPTTGTRFYQDGDSLYSTQNVKTLNGSTRAITQDDTAKESWAVALSYTTHEVEWLHAAAGATSLSSVMQMATGGSLNVAALTATGNITANGVTLPAGLPQVQVYTSGSGTYTTPTGARWLKARLVGGGGGGGNNGSGSSGNPGAQGGYVEWFITSPASSYSYGAGAAGAGAASGATPANGSAGGNTTFGTATAGGGAGGLNSGAASVGGTASGGTINIAGTNSGSNNGGSASPIIGPSGVIASWGAGGYGGNAVTGGATGGPGGIIVEAYF